MEKDFPWQGYLNQIAYAVNLTTEVADETVSHVADELISQRRFVDPVEDYYRSIETGLGSRQNLNVANAGDEQIVRSFFSRLRAKLDEGRPWPAPPFATLEPHQTWPSLQDAAIVGNIPLSQRDIGTALNRIFHRVADAVDNEIKVMTLRLRTGQTVALRAPDSYVEPGVTLISHDDPTMTREAFAELTQLPVEPR